MKFSKTKKSYKLLKNNKNFEFDSLISIFFSFIPCGSFLDKI